MVIQALEVGLVIARDGLGAEGPLREYPKLIERNRIEILDEFVKKVTAPELSFWTIIFLHVPLWTARSPSFRFR